MCGIDRDMRHIQLAPPRETLMIFGGPYSIRRFREISQMPDVQVHVTLPPIKPLRTVTEETIIDPTGPCAGQDGARYTSGSFAVPLDRRRIQKATTELRLKRTKQQKNENTLENFMRLKIGV